MADRPILFSGPMVRALVDGRKTQTRRVLRPQPYQLEGRPGFWNASGAVGGRIVTNDAELAHLHRFVVGDRLWVREAWRTCDQFNSTTPRDLPRSAPIFFTIDDRLFPVARYRPGIHMPRWASRWTLTVSEVRLQRLQDISEEDAMAEGVVGHAGEEGGVYTAAYEVYAELWDRLNAKRGYGWGVNPWVVAVTFGVERRNINVLAGKEEAA